MKRKADDSIDGAEGEGSRKRTAIDPPASAGQDHFRESIFAQKELEELIEQYSESKPFVLPAHHDCESKTLTLLPQVQAWRNQGSCLAGTAPQCAFGDSKSFLYAKRDGYLPNPSVR